MSVLPVLFCWLNYFVDLIPHISVVFENYLKNALKLDGDVKDGIEKSIKRNQSALTLAGIITDLIYS